MGNLTPIEEAILESLTTDEERRAAVQMKLSILKEVVKDKRIVLIDDSIVRGTTMRQIIEMLKEAGAKEVHCA